MTILRKLTSRLSPRIVFGCFAIGAAVGLTPAIIAILQIPADPKRVALFGFSIERLLMLGASLFIFAFLLVAGVLVIRNGRIFSSVEKKLFHSETQKSRTMYALIGLAIILWALLWIPASRYGQLQPDIERMRPLLIWLIVCVVFCIGLIRHLFAVAGASHFRPNRLNVLRWLITSALFFLVVAGGYFYSDPVNSTEVLYEAGVPILNEQIWLALLLGLIVWGVENYYDHRIPETCHALVQRRARRLDVILCLSMFLFSAVLWVREPVRPSYFAPGPYPPNHELFPYSDAVSFDIASQYAYDGQGINAGRGYYR
ncbi:MAG: hypothetical protein U1B80_03790, partial [Anaerolineaceae bacterium]|nr:hypothetical protein [Anaerolineaceae bacterium]